MDELKGKLIQIDGELSGSIDAKGQGMTGSLRFDEADAAGVLSNTFLRGWSAYEVWLAQGNVGTEQDFFDSLASAGSTDVDYNLIKNRPQINSIVLEGDRALPEEELSNLEVEAIFKL
jgi:hypothetical protein